jgi:predicted NBD/HSP70 family sugar kinase
MSKIMSDNELRALLSDQPPASPTGRIVRALSQKGPMSAREIGESTGLAKSTETTALAELRRARMVVDGPGDNRTAGAGRPATTVSLNPEVGTCVGLLIGMEHMQLIIADVSHALLAEAVAAKLLADAYEEQNLSRDTLLGIGIAMAGPVNPEDGRMLRAGGMPHWAGLDIRATFEPALLQSVIADNESNCSAVAEMMWGAAVGHSNFVLFTLDKGIGGAIVHNGAVIQGIAGAAGEFGHMSINPDGPLCRCGNRGCLEVYASLRMPVELASKRFCRKISIADLVSMAEAGDPGCIRLIEDTAAAAGRGLALVGSALNPPLIVVGGRLAVAGDLMLKPLEESYNRHTLVKRADVSEAARTQFVTAKFLNNSSCMGAVGLVLRHFGQSEVRYLG